MVWVCVDVCADVRYAGNGVGCICIAAVVVVVIDVGVDVGGGVYDVGNACRVGIGGVAGGIGDDATVSVYGVGYVGYVCVDELVDDDWCAYVFRRYSRRLLWCGMHCGGCWCCYIGMRVVLVVLLCVDSDDVVGCVVVGYGYD